MKKLAQNTLVAVGGFTLLVLYACSLERKGTRDEAAFDWGYFGWALAIVVGIVLFVVWDQWPQKKQPPEDKDRDPPSSDTTGAP